MTVPIQPKKGNFWRPGMYGRCNQMVRMMPSPKARQKVILATPKAGWFVHSLKLSRENEKTGWTKDLQKTKYNRMSKYKETTRQCTFEITIIKYHFHLLNRQRFLIWRLCENPNHMKTNASKEKLDRRLELQFSKKIPMSNKNGRLNNKNCKLNVIFFGLSN